LTYLAATAGRLSFVHIDSDGYDAIFLSAMLFMLGVWQILASVSTRYRQFRALGLSKAALGVITALGQILIASTALKSMGLLIGDIAGRASSLVALRRSANVIFAPTELRVFDAAREHKHLITKGTLAALCNGFSLQSLPLFFIAIWSEEAAASVFLVQRVLRAPAGLVAESISRVFVSDYSLCRSQNDKKIMQKKYLVNILKVGVVPAFIIFAFGPLLMTYAFGNSFSSASLFIRPLLIYTLVHVASSSISQAIILNNRPGLQLAWDVSRAISLVILFSACEAWCIGADYAIWLFSLIMCSFGVAHILVSRITITSSGAPC
jgi:O-antigen/teichoic acid export membrane protein